MVNADRKRVDQGEALGVFGQHWREIAWNNVAKPQSLTDKS
jgi:hypothetical protein